jgi:hypothetical protein
MDSGFLNSFINDPLRFLKLIVIFTRFPMNNAILYGITE